MRVQASRRDMGLNCEMSTSDLEISEPAMYTTYKHLIYARNEDRSAFIEIAFTEKEWNELREVLK